MDQVGRDRLAAQEAEHALVTRLRSIVHTFMLRRTKAQVVVRLPPKREVVLRVRMTPDQQVSWAGIVLVKNCIFSEHQH